MLEPRVIKGQLVTFAHQEWTIVALNQKQESITLSPVEGGRDRIVVWSPEVVPIGYDVSICTECKNTYLIDSQFTIKDARGTAIFCQECKRCRKMIRNRKATDLNEHPHLYKGTVNFDVRHSAGRSGTLNKHVTNIRLAQGSLGTED